MKNTIIMWTMMFLLSSLTACGGSDSTEGSRFATPEDKELEDTNSDGNDGEVGNDGIDEGDLTNVSFLPLMTIERYKEWFDDTNQDVFLYTTKFPLIIHYTVNPINASTLAPITTAKASDFTILEDGIPVNPKVGFPLLQKVVGNTTQLTTALVINTSSSMDSVDKDAFIQEIKDFVAAAKASTTPYLANQGFTVWGFDGVAVEETSGVTTSAAAVNTALDTVLTKWKADTYAAANGANHAYDAVVEAIGRYVGDGAFSTGNPIEFRDSLSGETNDLVDFITPDLNKVTSVVVFSAGLSNTDQFDDEFVAKALESQSTLVYEEGVEVAGADTETVNYPKSLIYVVPDGEPKDDVFVGLATSVIENTISAGEYAFASQVLSDQKSAIDKKISLDNQHVLRWALGFRKGDNHSFVVKTRTPEDSYGYSLTVSPVDFGTGVVANMPTPQVEITGANNEYLAAGANTSSYNAAITYADEITRFYPATRWTNQTFTSTDYSWSSTPASAFTENADGSVTINTASLPITLTLTNNNIKHLGSTISDDFVLTINASK